MVYTDIFHSVELEGKTPKTPEGLMKLGVNTLGLARNAELRKKHRFDDKRELVESSDGEHRFPMVGWNRQLGLLDIQLNLVDKRAAEIGLLLTARAGVGRGGIEVVKAFVIDDDFSHRGLNRAVNDGLPDDLVDEYLAGWHSSVRPYPVHASPSVSQYIDFAKALATVHI